MLTCGCGNWMHTEGVEERVTGDAFTWFVRSECRPCGWVVGIDVPAGQAAPWVDRLLWSDEARHRLDRLPPYVAPLMREMVEQYARQHQHRVVTYELIEQAKTGDVVVWDPEAEQRLANVPAPVRAMARIELERTAVDRGSSRVTVAMMEEVKARYFGMAARKNDG
ncbi:MAG: PCP reductase family protein [Nitrospiraceae bacterium]